MCSLVEPMLAYPAFRELMGNAAAEDLLWCFFSLRADVGSDSWGCTLVSSWRLSGTTETRGGTFGSPVKEDALLWSKLYSGDCGVSSELGLEGVRDRNHAGERLLGTWGVRGDCSFPKPSEPERIRGEPWGEPLGEPYCGSPSLENTFLSGFSCGLC